MRQYIGKKPRSQFLPTPHNETAGVKVIKWNITIFNLARPASKLADFFEYHWRAVYFDNGVKSSQFLKLSYLNKRMSFHFVKIDISFEKKTYLHCLHLSFDYREERSRKLVNPRS